MIARAGELAREPGTYATDQFNNPYVAAGFRDTLGRELREQSGGRVTAFVHGDRHRWLADGRLRSAAVAERRDSGSSG